MTVARLVMTAPQGRSAAVAAGTAAAERDIRDPGRLAASRTASGTATAPGRITLSRRPRPPRRAAGAHRRHAVSGAGQVPARSLATGTPGTPATSQASTAAIRWPMTCATGWECATGQAPGQLRARAPGEGSGHGPADRSTTTATGISPPTAARLNRAGTRPRGVVPALLADGLIRDAARARSAGAAAATAVPGQAGPAVVAVAARASGSGCSRAAGGGTGPGRRCWPSRPAGSRQFCCC